MNPTTQPFHRTRFARAAAVLLVTALLVAGCANTSARLEVASQGAAAQVAGAQAASPKFSVEALGSAPASATPSPAAAATAEPAPTATASASVQADVRSGGSNATAGTGDVVVRARSTVNGTAYEVLCTRTGGGGGQASSVAVRQQTTTENGVVKARVVLSTNGNEYSVVVDGVANASALAALNSSLTNVSCTVSA